MGRVMIEILTTILAGAVLVGLGRKRALATGRLRGAGLRRPEPPRGQKGVALSRAA